VGSYRRRPGQIVSLLLFLLDCASLFLVRRCHSGIVVWVRRLVVVGEVLHGDLHEFAADSRSRMLGRRRLSLTVLLMVAVMIAPGLVTGVWAEA
jgi:hypothetical protein